MSSRRRTLALVVALSFGALVPSLVAVQSAGALDLVFGAGSYTANTSALTLSGPAVFVTGSNVNGVAVFKFGNVTIPSTTTITAIGSRPFELVATGSLVIAGAIVSSGVNATTGTIGPNAGGAGGGAGGTDGSVSGGGPGGGGHATVGASGAGGGGFAAAGAPGGIDGGAAGAGGVSYGDLDLLLQGGSGGAGGNVGGGSRTGGGGGGGAIGLFGASVTLQATAVIVAVGGNGSGAGAGASGGGSGGGIIVHGTTVRLNGVLDAIGGNGGTGGCCGDGGGGAGGRIAIQFKTLYSRSTLVAVVTGGTSGGSGPYAHGELSAMATGGPGIVTFTHIDASQLSIGANRSVPKGAKVAVSGRLVDGGSATGVAHATVGLYRRALPSGAWTLAATRTTAGGGQVAAPVKVTASTAYQWRYLGALVHGPAVSPIQILTVT